MRKWILLGLMIPSFIQPAYSAGLRTHIWIADEVLRDAADCEVNIAGVSAPIAPELCSSLKSDPEAFRAGMMGPDVFPDLITGQVTTHPGIEGDWQTADWIKTMLAKSSPGQELSFSAGYATHAAVDMFAHSYVNAYSGDIFLLKGERRVELRHFVLEKYIDYKLPSAIDVGGLKVPVGFVTANLLYNDDAARHAGKVSLAAHISAMNSVRRAVGELDDKARDVDKVAFGTLGKVTAQHLKLQEELVTGEAQLKLTEEGLKLNENLLAEQQRVLDKVHDELLRAIDKAEGAENELNLAISQEDNINRAIRDAEGAITNLNNEIHRVEKQGISLAETIASLPDTIASKLCDDDWWNPFCWIEQVANPTKKKLREEAARLASRISGWKRDLANTHTNLASLTAQQAVAVNARIAKQSTALRYDGLRKAAQAAYNIEKVKYDAQLKVTRETRSAVTNIREEIGRLKARIIDTAALRDKVEKLIADLKFVSLYTTNWVKGIDVAGDEYIKTSLVIGQKITTNDSGAFSELRRWLNCYGGAFTPTPYQFGEIGCNAVAEYERVQARIDALILDLLPQPFDRLYSDVLSLKALAKGAVKDELENAALELVKLGAPDGTTAEFIELLVRPESATADRLNEVFASADDAGGKALLTFPDVASMINQDMRMKNGRLDPNRFTMVRHATTMAKLALLNGDGLRHLVWRLGSDRVIDKPAGRYTVLQDSVRSIDGNHQWQPFALPYPRSGGVPPEPANAADRHFGYGPAEGAGFILFIDPQLRQEVFPLLFPGGLGGVLMKRPELLAPYPFIECTANPFPVAFTLPAGGSAAADLRCAEGGNAIRQPFRQKLKRFWRSITAAFGSRGPALRTQ